MLLILLLWIMASAFRRVGTRLLAVVYGIGNTRPVMRRRALCQGDESKMTPGRMKRTGMIYRMSRLLFVVLSAPDYYLLI